MKKILLAALCCAGTAALTQAATEKINWSKPKVRLIKFSTEGTWPDQVLKFDLLPKVKNHTWSSYIVAPWTPKIKDATGISFEVKGDGSKYFATVFLAYTSNVFNGYEASFPLSSKGWEKVYIPFSKFIQNDLPWAVKRKVTVETLTLDPGKIKAIGFGRGSQFHKFYPKQCKFEIRNIALAKVAAPKSPAGFSKGLDRTIALIKAKKPVTILLLGDSITDFGRNRTYAYYCGQMITKHFGSKVNVVNCGIGGHTVRGGCIVLPRSLRTMPKPDLVCMLYGANDCKAVTPQSGFGSKAFQSQIEKLIDEVRAGTGGKTDILLINGVPRLENKGRLKSSGAVEKIVNGVKAAAAAKDTAYLDTFNVYLKLDPQKRLKYYRDSIHQQDAGQRFIGDLMFKEISNKLK